MKNIIVHIRQIAEKQKVRKYFTIVFFALATIYFFSKIFYGLDFTDGFFHLNQAGDRIRSNNFFTFFLSSYFIKGIMNVIGHDLINIRFINSLFLFLSVLIPFFFLQKKRSRHRYFFLASIILILLTALNPNILGYDTLSVLGATLIFIIITAFLRNANIYLLLIISFLSVLNTFIRLPNLYLIPIIALVVYTNGFKTLKSNKFNGSFYGVVYLLLTLCLIGLGYFLYFHNISEFPQDILKNHRPEALLFNYFNDLIVLILYVFCWLLFYFAVKRINKAESILKSFIGFLILAIMSSAFLINFILLTKYSRNFSLLLSALAISFVLIELIKKNNNYSKLISFLFLLFLFMIPFGSNTGLLKASLMIVLLPFVFVSSRMGKTQVWMLLFILPFSVIENIYSIYEDKNIFALKSSPKIEVLSSVRTSKTRAEYLENIDEEVHYLRQQGISVYFYGDKSHIFTYLYPDTYFGNGTFFQPLDDPKTLIKIQSQLNFGKKMAIFIVDSYPDHENSIEDSKLVKGLKEIDFQIVKNNNLVYYLHR